MLLRPAVPKNHHRNRHRTRRLVVAAAALLVLAGCGSTVAGTATTQKEAATGGTTGGPVPEGLQEFYSQELSWEDCAGYAQTESDQQTYADPSFRCAHLRVPVSYDDPDAPGEVTIGVLKVPATGPDRMGSVMFNPGGPGASGMSMASQYGAYGIGADLRERFDLVGFDPRGTGASRPAIDCRNDAERDAQRAANIRTTTPEGVQAANRSAEEFVQGCLERTGRDEGVDAAAYLGSVGTHNVVKDMDILRAVLGDDKLTYVGYSYGTRLGTEYAEQFTGTVRAMILDGAVDPNLDAASAVIEQGKGFQDAFTDYATACAAEPDCPLGNDPAAATESYQQLVRPLLDEPVQLADGRVLTFDDASTGTIQAMYSESLWPQLTSGLKQLANGKGDELMALADSYEGRDSAGHYSNLMDAFTAIRCMDDERQDPATAADLNKRYYAQAPFLDSGDPYAAVKDTCDFWPAEPTSEPHVPDVPGLAKVLVISTTGDPATPYQAGVDLAKYLDGALLTVEGTRHTAYLGAGIPCVDDIGDAYLIDLTIPEDGATC